jgi:hypothetical protein
MLALPWLVVWWRPWRVVNWRPALAAALVAIALATPWVAYQHFYDPPGNRLLKLHFAGVDDIDSRGTVQAVLDTYRALSWQQYLSGRWANVRRQWFEAYPLPLESPIDWVQWQQLLHYLPLIGFLGVGYVRLFTRPPAGTDLSDDSLRLTRQLAWFSLITMVIWMVLMIVPASALIHQGSYVMAVLLLICGAIFTATLPPAIRRSLLTLHVLLFAACYFFSTRVAVADAPMRPSAFVAAGVLFAMFALCLRLLPD